LKEMVRLLAEGAERRVDMARIASDAAYRRGLPEPSSFSDMEYPQIVDDCTNFPSFSQDTAVTQLPNEIHLYHGYYAFMGYRGGRMLVVTFAYRIFGAQLRERYALMPVFMMIPWNREGRYIRNIAHPARPYEVLRDPSVNDTPRWGDELSEREGWSLICISMLQKLRDEDFVNLIGPHECFAFTNEAQNYADDAEDETYEDEGQE
ncbi:hypothetical protein KCU73_g17546, partial [Aureobasidium melanogenum]